MIQELIRKNRSCRRFHENRKLPRELLLKCVNSARLSPSSRNLQPLKYILSENQKENGILFHSVSWAAHLGDEGTPEKGERPSAYILILGDRDISKSFYTDAGIAAQSILLTAVEEEAAGCILSSIDHEKVRIEMNIPEKYEIIFAVALGYPLEFPVIEEMKSDDQDIRYWRDENQVHHVPKRSLESIIIQK